MHFSTASLDSPWSISHRTPGLSFYLLFAMCAQANNSRFLDDDMFRGEKESNESNESNESKDSDMESFLLLEKHQQKIQPRCLIGSLSRFTHGISLLVCLGLLINTVVVSKTCRKSCLERFNAYCEVLAWYLRLDISADLLPAPVLEAINEEYQDIRFKYSLWYQSPYKGPPTPEVHQAWNNIMQCKHYTPSRGSLDLQ